MTIDEILHPSESARRSLAELDRKLEMLGAQIAYVNRLLGRPLPAPTPESVRDAEFARVVARARA